MQRCDIFFFDACVEFFVVPAAEDDRGAKIMDEMEFVDFSPWNSPNTVSLVVLGILFSLSENDCHDRGKSAGQCNQPFCGHKIVIGAEFFTDLRLT